MSKLEKILLKVLRGTSDTEIPFADLQNLLISLGFRERIRGSHHIFTRDDVIEIINLQPVGSKSKAYQVKQIRQIILKYRLGGSSEDQV